MEIYLVARWSDGSVSHEAMQLDGRFPAQPTENGWRFVSDGTWVRASNDANCAEYLVRVAQRRLDLDGVTLLGWRRITQQEHELFERDREYRNALEDVDGQCQHNMVKARELHRTCLRHQNGAKLLLLDREWVDCAAKGDTGGASAVEAKRQALRDALTDPQIEACTNVIELKQLLVSREV